MVRRAHHRSLAASRESSMPTRPSKWRSSLWGSSKSEEIRSEPESTDTGGSHDVQGDRCSSSCSSLGTDGKSNLSEIVLAPHQVLRWDDRKFEMVRTLEQAKRNRGTVDLMHRLSDGQFVAVKRMPNDWVGKDSDDFCRKRPTAHERPWFDLGMLRYLNEQGFEFTVKLEGIMRDKSLTYAITSFADRGELFAWCGDDTPVGAAREEKMRPLCRQLFAAVQWLHDHGIAHRDISLENILLQTGRRTEDLQLKLIDFGMATTSERYCSRTYGKPSYQPPEMHTGMTFDAYLSDNFALGVVVFAMACQDYPWRTTKPGQCKRFESFERWGFRRALSLRNLPAGSTGATLDRVLSPDLVDMMEPLLSLVPKSRGSMGEGCFLPGRPSVWDSRWLGIVCL